MRKKQFQPPAEPDLERDAATLLAPLENALAAVARFTPPPGASANALSDEFVRLCLQSRTAPREDVNVALRQMRALVESLPLPALIHNPKGLTIRTLLRIALEPHAKTPRLHCHALGYSYLERPLTNGKHKRTAQVQGELLAFFLLQPGRSWSDEQVCDAIWAGKDLQQAQWAFHAARKRLHQFASAQVILKLQRGQYVLNPEVTIWFDVAEFENLLARAQTIAHPAAPIELLESAVQLYRGDLLDKSYKDWVMPIRTYLREKYIGALLELGSLTQQESSPQQALRWYEQALRADNLNEDTYLQLIRLHLQVRNPIAAHRTLVLMLDTFQRELDAPPSEDCLATARSLLGDAPLTAPLKDG